MNFSFFTYMGFGKAYRRLVGRKKLSRIDQELHPLKTVCLCDVMPEDKLTLVWSCVRASLSCSTLDGLRRVSINSYPGSDLSSLASLSVAISFLETSILRLLVLDFLLVLSLDLYLHTKLKFFSLNLLIQPVGFNINISDSIYEGLVIGRRQLLEAGLKIHRR